MSTIGTFTKNADGAYTGAINTLSLNVKSVAFRPNDKTNPEAPDYRIFAGKVELGAAWKKTSAEQRNYLSVKLDDPSFNAPIFANLFEDEDGENYSLIWSRPRKQNGS